MRTRLAACILLAAGAAVAAGCTADPTQGWSATSTFPTDLSTIAIEVIENRTYDRGYEFGVSLKCVH